MTHLENFCCALAIFGLAVAAGWWWLGSMPDRQAITVVMGGEHGE